MSAVKVPRRFRQLKDVPASYAGQALKATRVNAGETALEYYTPDFAAVSHTHAAGDITSGVFATARLGTGTADNTTYLRGDSTWQTVSGGATDLEGLSDVDLTSSASGHILQSDGTNYVNRTPDDAGLVTKTGPQTIAGAKILSDPLTGTSATFNGPANETTVTLKADAQFVDSASGQLRISGADTSKRLQIGFDTTGNFGWIRAVQAGVAERPLVLNQDGSGNVLIGTTIDSGHKLNVNGTFNITGVLTVGNYTVATLPTPAAGLKGAHGFATDGRAGAEGVGAGTGVTVACNGSSWRRFEDWGVVAA